MNRFASNTSVPVERSQAELQRLVRQHGASTVATMQTETGAAVAFQVGAYRVRLELDVPTTKHFLDAAKQDKAPRGWLSWDEKRRLHWAREQVEQVERQRWRALLLVTKAKFELIAEGASSIEREFMADLLLPNGQRVEQWLVPQLKDNEGKRMPPLLPGAQR